ncbi:hypothetical protein BDQ17DRAFT_110811 [Cyathus striatus]|nr:hypothetical protein BDQ17DRAFT_110811 [Cyathus striatus]
MITSGLSLVPLPTVQNYCATRVALHSFTVSLRAMLLASGSMVKVVEVYPPLVESESLDRTPPFLRSLSVLIRMVNSVWNDGEAIEALDVPGGVRSPGYAPLLSGEENIPIGNSKDWWERFGEGENEDLARARLARRRGENS